MEEPQYIPPADYESPAPEKKSNTMWIIIAVVVVALILCCCCSILGLVMFAEPMGEMFEQISSEMSRSLWLLV
jgi:flagellar basal body-associated protein FliL